METQTFTPAQSLRQPDWARPAHRPEAGRPERPDPEAIAKRLRHLAQDTRKEAQGVRDDVGDLEAKTERLRALHQEAVETGNRKLHHLVHRLAKHLEVELRETRSDAQGLRAQIAFTKQLIERFKDFMAGEEEGSPSAVEADVPAGELLDVSA